MAFLGHAGYVLTLFLFLQIYLHAVLSRRVSTLRADKRRKSGHVEGKRKTIPIQGEGYEPISTQPNVRVTAAAADTVREFELCRAVANLPRRSLQRVADPQVEQRHGLHDGKRIKENFEMHTKTSCDWLHQAQLFDYSKGPEVHLL